MNTPTLRPTGGADDFDFLIGTWTTQQRCLKKRLQGNDEWETFAATVTMARLPGGTANFDTMVAEGWRPGWVGMTLRVFNPVTNLWSIFWFTNNGGGIDAAKGGLDTPVVGRFDGDVGIFECDDTLEGRAIRMRYEWTKLGADAARWQQSFSPDGGQTWEVNWVGEFERAEPTRDSRPGSPPGSPPALSPTSASIRPPIPSPKSSALDVDCNLIELRQYTLHPGQRDVLIDLFDREFVETQEAVGMSVMGQFRDLGAADRFVWLRGFPDMRSRAQSLGAFYGGPVWQTHREAANATMVDSDNVLLLRPAWPGAGISMRGRARSSGAVRMALPGLLEVSIFPLRAPAASPLLHLCREVMTPVLHRAGAEVLGWYVTELTPNDFPRLPVREGVPVLVVFAMFDVRASVDAFAQGGAWAREVQPRLAQWLERPAEVHRLVPTARSAIHG